MATATFHTSSNPDSANNTKQACNFCRASHVACDGERPCRRCVKRQLSAQCCDLAPRKRGRPGRADPRFRPKYPNKPRTHNHSTRRPSVTSSDSDVSGQQAGTPSSGSEERQHHSEGPEEGSYGQVDHDYYNPRTDDDDDDDDEEGDEEYYHHHHSSKEKESRRPRAAKQATDDRNPDLAATVIAMMADEMHQLRKENAKLRSKVKKLQKKHRKQADAEDRTQQNLNNNNGSNKRARYDPPPPHMPLPVQPAPAPMEPAMQMPAPVEHPGLVEARRYMPFLAQYRFPPDIPLVVDDVFGRPLFALHLPCVGASANFLFANDALADLLRFTPEGLRLTPARSVLSENPKTKQRLMPYLANRAPWSVSDIITSCPLMRCRDGSTLRTTTNMQFFYGPTGAVKFAIIVLLYWEEGQPSAEERFPEKIVAHDALVPAGHVATSQYPSHSSPVPHPPTALSPSVDEYWERVFLTLSAPATAGLPAKRQSAHHL